eukprot:scaffold42088_cov191-Amphora_coffeaeformis.AAC.1
MMKKRTHEKELSIRHGWSVGLASGTLVCVSCLEFSRNQGGLGWNILPPDSNSNARKLDWQQTNSIGKIGTFLPKRIFSST